MKKILYIILLSFILTQECNDECACNFTPNSSLDAECLYSIDLCGVCGGDNLNNDEQHCGDVQFIQDLIDANPSLEGDTPTSLSFTEWENGRLTVLRLLNEGLTSMIPVNIGELLSLRELNLS